MPQAVDFAALHQRVAALQVVPCRMIHERARVEGGEVVWMTRAGRSVLERVGLCAPEVRAARLACGHTTARILLGDALAVLHANGALDEASHAALAAELSALDNAIHLLDHRKGDAESAHARGSDPERTLARELEREHEGYAARLRVLRDEVLAGLERTRITPPPEVPMARSQAATPDEYLAELAPERRAVLSAARDLVRGSLPDGYRECMNWGMISYEVPLERYPNTYNGHPLSYAALAAQKNHFALYLMASHMTEGEAAWLADEFARAGKRLDMGKSCLRFRALDELATDAVATLIAGTTPDAFIARYEASRA